MEKSKGNKKKNKNIYYLFGFVLLFVILVLIIDVANINKKSYLVESRIDDIEKEKKNDTSEYNTIGWIRVQGTNIDYPIVAFKDDYSDSEIEIESYGWSVSKKEKYLNNMIIEGHNILNLSSTPLKESKTFTRFESLLSFVYYDFAKDNQFIQYTIDGKDYKYQIFAVTLLGPLSYNINIEAKNLSDKQKEEYIKFTKKKSLYNYKINVTKNDDFINVVTCTRMYGQSEKTNIVISAKRVDNNYKKYSKVEKNSNYTKIEKLMKGSDEDEEDI